MSLARLCKGDDVVVISGKDKGKKGKILRLFNEEGKVIVEGVNVIKRHLKPSPKSPQGGILEKEAPIFASKVMPVDPKTGKGTRVRVGKDDKGHKIRVGTSGEEIVAPKKSS